MMLDELKPHKGSSLRKKRVGRGPGSGVGRYCGRGIKGQGKRSPGREVPARFEGGQMPLARRLPKRGFASRRRNRMEIVNLKDLAVFGDGANVDPKVLRERGLIRRSGAPIKILGEGDPPKNLKVQVARVSAAARSKIEAAGGEVELSGSSG